MKIKENKLKIEYIKTKVRDGQYVNLWAYTDIQVLERDLESFYGGDDYKRIFRGEATEKDANESDCKGSIDEWVKSGAHKSQALNLGRKDLERERGKPQGPKSIDDPVFHPLFDSVIDKRIKRMRGGSPQK